MKIKRFNNIWTMGLILFVALLVAFYAMKLISPQFVIKIATLPTVVKFGDYVDSHTWSQCLFGFIISYSGGYISYCACLRTKKLNTKQCIALVLFLAIGTCVQYLLSNIYTAYNYITFLLIPFVLALMDHKVNGEIFTSTVVCFCIDLFAQAISLEIRDIKLMTGKVNCATLIILLIDTWIWRVLLYLYFSNKKIKERKV